MNRPRTLLLFVCAMALTACDQQQLTQTSTQLKAAADAAWARLGPSPCARTEIQQTLLQQSGFYVDDPVRGYQPADDIQVQLATLRAEKTTDDRVICLGEFVISGPQSTVVQHILRLNWATEPGFALEEISAGYNPQGQAEPGLWGMLGSITAVSVLAMTQAFEGDPEGMQPLEIRSDIEFAVRKKDNTLKAWAWVAGDSPGFHAGSLLRAKPTPAPH